MSLFLQAHHLAPARHQIAVTVSFTEDFVHFDFIVHNHTKNVNDSFGRDFNNNWGLWNFDVVEVFLQKEKTTHYLEIQLSPLAQPLALIIEKPREIFYAPKILNAKFHTEQVGQDWHSRISIFKDDIPGSGDKLMGNCFACLGNADQREYYALNINKEEKPDFHRPDLFVSLGAFV